jgi:drug/metabolite transporter (DMT)-like permease
MLIYFKLFLTAFFWGGAFVAGRSVAQTLDPFSAAFLRFALATVFLGMLHMFQRPDRKNVLTWRQTAGLAVLGLTGIAIYNVCFFTGLKLISASRASAIITNNPILVLFLSMVFFREKVRPLKILGILLSVTGACIVIFRGNITLMLQGSLGNGELAILGCVMSWAVYSVLGKKLLQTISPLQATFYATLFGTLFLCLPALRNGFIAETGHLNVQTWLCLLYLSLFATVLGFVWFYDGVKTIGPTRASQFVNLVPVNAFVLSYFLLHEQLSFSLLTGTLFVISGVFITQRSG